MKWVELRRHSFVDKDRNVTPEGVELAKYVRGQLNLKYDVYLCSPALRCHQTMEAFGFHSHESDEAFIVLPGDKLRPHMARVDEIVREKGVSLLEAFFDVPEVVETIKQRAKECLEGIKRVARTLPDGGNALVVSHGGTIEPAALLAKGTWDLNAIGGPLKECEGIIFKFDGEEIADIYVARIKRQK